MNKTTDFQKEIFYDIYRIALGAILSRNEFACGIGKEQAVLDALKIANASVVLLTDDNGLKDFSVIMEDIENEWERIKRTLE